MVNNKAIGEEIIMSDPVRASDIPFGVDVEEGQRYFWCACGRSQNQPFCDGSHKGTDFVPVKYVATETTQVFFCGCKSTQNPPLCDGSHNK
jgi:CDGSH-type Zn-finger protein